MLFWMPDIHSKAQKSGVLSFPVSNAMNKGKKKICFVSVWCSNTFWHVIFPQLLCEYIFPSVSTVIAVIQLRPIQWVKHGPEQLTDAQEAKHKQISMDLNSRGVCAGSGAPRQEVAVTGRCCWSSPLEAVGKHSAAPPQSVARPSLILALRNVIITGTDASSWFFQLPPACPTTISHNSAAPSLCRVPLPSSLFWSHPHCKATLLPWYILEPTGGRFIPPNICYLAFGFVPFFWPQLILIQSAVDDGKISFPIMIRFLSNEVMLFENSLDFPWGSGDKHKYFWYLRLLSGKFVMLNRSCASGYALRTCSLESAWHCVSVPVCICQVALLLWDHHREKRLWSPAQGREPWLCVEGSRWLPFIYLLIFFSYLGLMSENIRHSCCQQMPRTRSCGVSYPAKPQMSHINKFSATCCSSNDKQKLFTACLIKSSRLASPPVGCIKQPVIVICLSLSSCVWRASLCRGILIQPCLLLFCLLLPLLC